MDSHQVVISYLACPWYRARTLSHSAHCPGAPTQPVPPAVSPRPPLDHPRSQIGPRARTPPPTSAKTSPTETQQTTSWNSRLRPLVLQAPSRPTMTTRLGAELEPGSSGEFGRASRAASADHSQDQAGGRGRGGGPCVFGWAGGQGRLAPGEAPRAAAWSNLRPGPRKGETTPRSIAGLVSFHLRLSDNSTPPFARQAL